MSTLEEELVREIRKQGLQRLGSWILGYFPAPQPIRKHEGNSRPKLCLWIEQETGRLLNTTITDGDAGTMILDQTLRLMKNTGRGPRMIVVERGELRNRLSPLMKKLDIGVERETASQAFHRAKERITASINS